MSNQKDSRVIRNADKNYELQRFQGALSEPLNEIVEKTRSLGVSVREEIPRTASFKRTVFRKCIREPLGFHLCENRSCSVLSALHQARRGSRKTEGARANFFVMLLKGNLTTLESIFPIFKELRVSCVLHFLIGVSASC
jgi:hypothetical protein